MSKVKRYKINKLLEFVQAVKNRHPGLVIGIMGKERFLLKWGEYAICRLNGSLEEFDAFSFQYKVNKFFQVSTPIIFLLLDIFYIFKDSVNFAEFSKNRIFKFQFIIKKNYIKK